MLTRVLTTSLGLFALKSIALIRADISEDDHNATWTGIDRLRFPIWVSVVVYLSALQWLNRFVIIDQRIAAFAINDETGNDTPNGVRSLARESECVQRGASSATNWGSSPEIASDRIRHFKQ